MWDRHAADQFHHEERPAGIGRTGVEHPRNVGVFHQREDVAFGFEAGDYFLRVHAERDHLERHAAADGLLLLGHEDHATPAFAEFLKEFVATDRAADGGINRARRF